MTAQHLLALERANLVRIRQAQLRRDVGAGRTTVSHALADPAVAKLLLVDVLAWQHRWRVGTAERFLRAHVDDLFCSPWCKAGQLTDRQRALLARALRTDVAA